MKGSTTSRYVFVFGSLLVVGFVCLFQEVGLAASFLSQTPSVGETLTTNMDRRSVPSSKNRSSTVFQLAENVSSLQIFNNTTALPNSWHVPAKEEEKSLTMTGRVTSATKATIVVQLSGEMANNLQHIAHGLGLQLLAKDQFGIDCNIILRHHEGPNNRSPKPKWKSARDNIQKCFPNLAEWKFNQGNGKEFLQQNKVQQAWLGGKMDHIFGLINSGSLSGIRQGLEILANDVLIDPHRPWVDNGDDKSSEIRIPYLFSETLDVFPMIDLYYDQIRELMRFNDTACCAQVPDPDVSVFHFRNYESEMPERRAYEMGFAELAPSKVSTELFRDLQPGNRVGITTRTVNQRARNYVEALAVRGVNATIVTDQSAVQDFCFLKRAQKEVVGSARSTFVFWAALLGDASRARLYHVDNFGLRTRHADFWDRFTFNFTHPRLRSRLIFELYRAEE